MHAYYERHTYKMAPVRGTPMRWPMGDTRLWEKHAYERRAYEMAAYEAYKMAHLRDTPIR
jgi:hypothetical protein